MFAAFIQTQISVWCPKKDENIPNNNIGQYLIKWRNIENMHLVVNCEVQMQIDTLPLNVFLKEKYAAKNCKNGIKVQSRI